MIDYKTNQDFLYSAHSANATQYIRNVWGAIRFPRLDGTNNQIALQEGSLIKGALLLANQLLYG